jgi:lysophospholipase L1-like esterase
MKKNIIVLITSLSIFFLTAELIFRIIVSDSPPGTTYGKAVEENTDGFRDRDFIIPKPAKTYRILVLGDSFTWGIGLTLEETLPKQLEKRLIDASANKNIEVINASIPGFNTVQALLLLNEKGLKYDPDMILLIYNLNDIEFLPQLSSKNYDETKIIPKVEVDPGEDISNTFKDKGMRGLIRWFEVRSKFVSFLVPRVGSLLRQMGLLTSVEFSWVERIFQGYTDDSPGWLETKRGLREIEEICRTRGIVFTAAIYPLLVELKSYKGKKPHATLHNYLDSIEVPYVDLLTVFEGKNSQSYWINYVDGHPNAEAHRLAMEALLPSVKDFVAAKIQPTASGLH